MKTDFQFFYCVFQEQTLHNLPVKEVDTTSAGVKARFNAESPALPALSVRKFNAILDQQGLIEKINQQRPKIYLYTDFGGGKNEGKAVADLQTSGEIASAAWKSTLQKELHINDSAAPLSIVRAACCLAKTFPYDAGQELPLHTIVVHVIDPGVGDQQDKENALSACPCFKKGWGAVHRS